MEIALRQEGCRLGQSGILERVWSTRFQSWNHLLYDWSKSLHVTTGRHVVDQLRGLRANLYMALLPVVDFLTKVKHFFRVLQSFSTFKHALLCNMGCSNRKKLWETLASIASPATWFMCLVQVQRHRETSTQWCAVIDRSMHPLCYGACPWSTTWRLLFSWPNSF